MKNFNPQLGILVTPVSLEVLSDRDGLLDEVVEVLGDRRGKTLENVSHVLSAYPIISPAHSADRLARAQSKTYRWSSRSSKSCCQ